MRYHVLDPFKVKTSQGEMQLKAGQVITLSENKAIKLIEAGKINPIPETLNDLSPEQRESYEERAGIMQYDGGMSKEDAEKHSWCFSACMLTEAMSKLCERVRPCPKWN